MNREKRLATFTVKVPIQFTFAGDNNLDCEELIEAATKELYRRLSNGYFDIVEKDLEITNKITHYTREEIKARDEMWDRILRGLA